MKVIVDIATFNDFIGDSKDHAVVDITDRLRERIRTFHRVLNELQADFLQEFDYSPEFHFVSRQTRVDVVQLVVARDGDCWWTGCLKNTSIRWETGRIPFALLSEPDGSEHDLRENQDEDEDDEPEQQFLNRYRHCGREWEDRWSCACNDRCPVCDAEIEPYESEEIDAEESASELVPTAGDV
jgi:hypothetical protein